MCWRPKFSNFLSSFHNRVEFGTIFWRAFGISGGGRVEHPKPPLGTPLTDVVTAGAFRVEGDSKMCDVKCVFVCIRQLT